MKIEEEKTYKFKLHGGYSYKLFPDRNIEILCEDGFIREFFVKSGSLSKDEYMCVLYFTGTVVKIENSENGFYTIVLADTTLKRVEK